MNINYYIILKFSTNELMIDDLIITIVNKVKLQSSTHNHGQAPHKHIYYI